ncbi:MAG: hypothetical protein A3D92_06700 [Bacteroidetes bacterium RIFCSPHIGHO2_02_FULL_44_7]|nr:MAG: hypothetical protein A3D92_06700 [Bacteroidetes bacterium RIFCSPHIGHO2_02_FULL_44_7]
MDYSSLPEAPTQLSGNTVLTRLLDGLIFRYYWATEGLTSEDFEFRPCESSMNIRELLNHFHHLCNVTYCVLSDVPVERISPPSDALDTRNESLRLLSVSRKITIDLDDAALELKKFRPKDKALEYPVWNLLNGPIADALTHVGQITSWRRINGNPVYAHNPFLGKAL